MEKEKITAYLDRIHAPELTGQQAEDLGRLIVCHLQSVPFENIDVIDFGMVPELDEEKLYDKIVVRKRGGYCFEQNTLFGRLLSSLGYELYPVAVRVMWNRDYIPPLTHMGLVVTINDRKYYCDVGYGGPGPKGLLTLEKSEQKISGETFRVETADDGDFLIERLHHGEWKTILRFSDRAVRETDFQLMNFYCARNETVLFTKTRVINLCTPSGSKALTDRELTIRENGGERRIVYNTVEELEAGLENEFGIRLQPAHVNKNTQILQ